MASGVNRTETLLGFVVLNFQVVSDCLRVRKTIHMSAPPAAHSPKRPRRIRSQGAVQVSHLLKFVEAAIGATKSQR